MTKEEKLKKYPQTEKFEVVDTIGIPHPYCIGTKHVAWVADHWGGILNKEAMKDAEENGQAKCCICKGELTLAEHKQALLINVKDERKLKDIPELKSYLLTIKELAEKDGFVGFAFNQVK